MLRPYQENAVQAIFDYFSEGGNGHPLIVAPTGSGKSHIIAEFVRRVCESPKTRIIILSHVREILEQNAQKLIAAWPGAPLGIYSAGLRSKRIARVTIASIQSIYRQVDRIPAPDFIVCDECHLIPKAGHGRYLSFIKNVLKWNPKCKVVGFTATPYRLDSGLLTEGENRIFTDIAYNISIQELVDGHYLVPLRSKSPQSAQADLSNVKKIGGEYLTASLEKAFDLEELTTAAIDEIERYALDRKSWLIFCVSVAHAEHVCSALNARGHSAKAITGDTPAMIRDCTIAKFRANELKALVNCNVLTTGFDSPCIDMIALLRSTCSTGLFVQMLGRGMRPAEGKTDCLVLDFGGNLKKHGPIDQIEIVTKRTNGKPAVKRSPTKICPQCYCPLPVSSSECLECGYIYPARKVQHDLVASVLPIMARREPPQKWEVNSVKYSRHQKQGSPMPVFRVDYTCGLSKVSEFVCFEHSGFPGEIAADWWRRHGGELPIPATVLEACSRSSELKEPRAVWVRWEGRFRRVVSVNFATEREQLERLINMEELVELGI